MGISIHTKRLNVVAGQSWLVMLQPAAKSQEPHADVGRLRNLYDQAALFVNSNMSG